jgi:hypothetical protein
MMVLIQGASKIYSILLRLFPRDFQNEFREEMEDVFTVNLREAAKTSGILAVRACFFELFDLPFNLVVEHLSSLRKGNRMKTVSFEFSQSRAVLMAALGMMMGWILIIWGYGQSFIQILYETQPWAYYLVTAIEYTLPIILCGLMLGMAAGDRRQVFVRIGLWTAAGGILGHLVNIPVYMITLDILRRAYYLPTREEAPIIFFCALAVMCVYGFFYGAGLGFALGGWKTCLKFALIGLVAIAIGYLTGYFISSFLAPRVPLGNSGPAYIEYGVAGALLGGILGWFFGKERLPEAGPVVGTSIA